ncbi:polysaccharide deacetylase family protein [Treponema sp. R6D11]
MKKFVGFAFASIILLCGVFVAYGINYNKPVATNNKPVVTDTPSPSPTPTPTPSPSGKPKATQTNTAKNISIPILMYHTSKEAEPKSSLAQLYVKPSEFEKQVSYLNDAGYTTVTFDDWGNLKNIKKPVMLTFDDGYLENYTEIFPILKKYNVKITLFLTLNNIKGSFNESKIKEMSDSGLVKFESHTLTHPSLVQASKNNATLTKEIGESKTKVEAITGKPVLALAYPNGEYNDAVIKKTKEYYKYGLRKDGGKHNTNLSNFEIRRSRVNRSTTLASFKQLVK